MGRERRSRPGALPEIEAAGYDGSSTDYNQVANSNLLRVAHDAVRACHQVALWFNVVPETARRLLLAAAYHKGCPVLIDESGKSQVFRFEHG
jgi:hypothetical protein